MEELYANYFHMNQYTLKIEANIYYTNLTEVPLTLYTVYLYDSISEQYTIFATKNGESIEKILYLFSDMDIEGIKEFVRNELEEDS